jgi:hypothetical protein
VQKQIDRLKIKISLAKKTIGAITKTKIKPEKKHAPQGKALPMK